ncbi:MAG: hypothetical protein H0V09_10355 [Gemmatimonadetes bacterium]|nr:hypothetical protein [Gemmatimonadota bacterium]
MARSSPTQAASAYLLTGEDEGPRAERLSEILSERLDETGRAFDLDRLSAKDADASRLATLLETPPLMGLARIVVLEDAETAAGPVERVVRDFLDRPASTTCLIATSSARLAGEPWNSFRKCGGVEVFDPPKGPAAIRARVKQEVGRAGREITDAAAALLAELHPEGTAGLGQEVAKAIAHAGERRRIEEADVEAVTVSSAGGNRYTFVDLVGMGRRGEALAELRRLLEGGESAIYLVTLLAQHFLVLGGIRACEAAGIRTSEGIASRLGRSAWQIDRKNFRIRGYEAPRVQARRYDRPAMDRWLAGLLTLDVALKSSRLPTDALMEETVLRLMSGASAGRDAPPHTRPQGGPR